MDIGSALASLDHTNDEHWTADDLPRLEAINKLVGRKVQRLEVTNAQPGFVRSVDRLNPVPETANPPVAETSPAIEQTAAETSPEAAEDDAKAETIGEGSDAVNAATGEETQPGDALPPIGTDGNAETTVAKTPALEVAPDPAPLPELTAHEKAGALAAEKLRLESEIAELKGLQTDAKQELAKLQNQRDSLEVHEDLRDSPEQNQLAIMRYLATQKLQREEHAERIAAAKEAGIPAEDFRSKLDKALQTRRKRRRGVTRDESENSDRFYDHRTTN